jgi:hypothetical protein
MARDHAVDSFRTLAERGQLRAGVAPEPAALAFVALMDGLQVQWLTMPAEVDVVGTLRFYLAGLLTVPLDQGVS